MPHPKRSLIAEERALANSFAEHSRRLNRAAATAQQLNAVHPHFRHDFEPDVTEAALVRQDAPQPAPRLHWAFRMGEAVPRILTRRRVKPL